MFPLDAVVEENCTNRLFTQAEVGGDVEQLASARGGLAPELVHQLLTGGAGDEGSDDIGVRDVAELGALLGETLDEISERLIRFLSTTPEVLGVPRAHVCALEVSDKDPNQVCPAVDQTLGRCSSHALAESARCSGRLRMMSRSSSALPSWHARR